jgi:hypothetical protein
VSSSAAVTLVIAAALAGVWVTGAAAQSLPPQPSRPLFSVKGWQHGTSPSGLQTAQCKPPVCASESMTMYSFGPPDPGLTFEKYRQSAESHLGNLQRNTANRGMQYKLLGVSDASKADLRMFKTRYLVTASDGKQMVFIAGDIVGTRHLVALTSSAATEKEADTNFTQFAAPLYLFANDKLEKGIKGQGK